MSTISMLSFFIPSAIKAGYQKESDAVAEWCILLH